MSTVIAVGTAALHLSIAPEKQYSGAVLISVIQNELLQENILKLALNGMGSKINNGVSYAKDNYTLAFPTGKNTQINVISSENLNYLIALNISYPNGVINILSDYDNYSPKIAALTHLLNERNYDSTNNSIAHYPPYTDVTTKRVYLDSIVSNIDNTSVTISYSIYNFVTVDSTYFDAYDILQHVSTSSWVKEDNLISEIVASPVMYNNNTFGDSCFYAIYQKLDYQGALLPKKYLWLYFLSTKMYPELDGVITEFISDKFIPVIPLRYNNVDLTDTSLAGTPLYDTSKKLLKKFGMSLDYLGEQINKHPNIAEIDHAYVMFGVDLQSNKSESIQYLNIFFDHIFNTHTYTNYSISASDNIEFTEHGLNLKLKYDLITSDEIPFIVGKGKIGESTKSIVLTTHPAVYNDDPVSGAQLISPEYVTGLLTIDTQITKSLTRRVTVSNLILENKIYRGHSVITTLKDIYNDPANHNLIIPIEFNIANQLSITKRNALYTDSSLLIINTVVIRHLKWYEESWFKFVVIIVMVIILVVVTWLSWGSLTAYWVSLMAMIESGSYAIAAAMVIIPLLISIAITYTAKWFVSKYGAKLGIIGAVLLSIAAIALSGGTAGFVLIEQYSILYSQLALQTAAALISSANEFLIETGQKIVNEYADFSAKMEDKYQELKTATDLLEIKHDVDPLIFAKPKRFKPIYESPDAFIQRCLGLPENTMYILHNEIPNFCSNRLILPKNVSPSMYGMNLYA